MTPSLATDADIDPIVDLVNAAYRGPNAAEGWSQEGELLDGQRTDAESLREAVDTGATLLLLRSAPDGPPLACVSVERREGSRVWYLGMLTVHPRRQDRGLGRIMLEAAENYAREGGATRIEMTVIQLRDTLIAWYERRGYRRTGETAPFPYGDDRFGLPKRSDLYFVVLAKDL